MHETFVDLFLKKLPSTDEITLLVNTLETKKRALAADHAAHQLLTETTNRKLFILQEEETRVRNEISQICLARDASGKQLGERTVALSAEAAYLGKLTELVTPSMRSDLLTRADDFQLRRGLTVIDWDQPIEIGDGTVTFFTLPGNHLMEPSSGAHAELYIPAMHIKAGAFPNGSYGRAAHYKVLNQDVLSDTAREQQGTSNTHPHILSSTGEACLNDFAPPLLSTALAADFLTVLAIVGEHICSYNDISPYRHLRDWIPNEVNPWEVPYCPTCKCPFASSCTCQHRVSPPRCPYCLREIAPEQPLSSCGVCAVCCSTMHKFSLATLEQKAGINQTGCIYK